VIDLEGNYVFEAPRELLWDMVRDPEVLARILPGCDRLEEVNENEYQGQMKIKIGPVDGVFRGTVALSELQYLEGFHLVFNGRGPSGVVEGEGNVELAETPDGTEFRYSGKGQVSGRMATVGQRVMTSSARAITKQSLENLDIQVQARLQPAAAAQEAVGPGATQETPRSVPESAPPAPGQAEFMRGVAENMFEEMVPDPQQRRLLAGLALLTAVTVLLNWFANLIARRAAAEIKKELKD
jgi:carbon monoxide dehydrogenase subunit G